MNSNQPLGGEAGEVAKCLREWAAGMHAGEASKPAVEEAAALIEAQAREIGILNTALDACAPVINERDELRRRLEAPVEAVARERELLAMLWKAALDENYEAQDCLLLLERLDPKEAAIRARSEGGRNG